MIAEVIWMFQSRSLHEEPLESDVDELMDGSQKNTSNVYLCGNQDQRSHITDVSLASEEKINKHNNSIFLGGIFDNII